MWSIPVRLSAGPRRGLSFIAGSQKSKGLDDNTRRRRREGQVRGFDEVPHSGSNGWINLIRFWREDRFRSLHKHMERTFNTLGPIYRERLGSHESVNILLPADIGEVLRSEGLHPRRMTLRPWAIHRETRQHCKGVFLKNGTEWHADRVLLNREVMVSSSVHQFVPLMEEVAKDFCSLLRRKVEMGGHGDNRRSLTLDPSPDLFRFALEASCHVLYGERMGLFASPPSLEAQRFIWAVEQMLATTQPLLYLPVGLMHRLHTPLWIQHVTAWDHIFSDAEARIQRGCQRLQSRKPSGAKGELSGNQGHSGGVLGRLMEKGQLSLELIKANITELMAGGVDTTAIPLQFALYELARNPGVQERVRRQARESWTRAKGDPVKALQGAPLLKGTIKETLRLYPVGIMVQRYPVTDIVLQNYHIPAGTLVQACLYPLGRSKEVFQDPNRFEPARWVKPKSGQLEANSEEEVRAEMGPGAGFRSLAFGFGARQCVGRRIAENEMQLLLLHILLNFQLSAPSSADIETKYSFILQPETPPLITFCLL